MQLKEKEIVLAHEPDAAWIIALWKAIHGGDPAPEAVAAGVIASMAPYLRSFGETFTAQQLEAGFETLGVKVTQPQVEGRWRSTANSSGPDSIASSFRAKRSASRSLQ